MSKSIAIRALVGTLVLCVPAAAATTISDDGIGIWLRGLEQVAPNAYSLAVGQLALLQIAAHPGDIVAVYAAPSDDLSQFFRLADPTPVDAAGNYLKFFVVPPEAAGMTFMLQAIVSDGMKRHLTDRLKIGVSDAQILHAPPPTRARLATGDPVLVE